MRMGTGALACLPAALLAPRMLRGDSKLGGTREEKKLLPRGCCWGLGQIPRPDSQLWRFPTSPGAQRIGGQRAHGAVLSHA